ncbi:MAG: hypothetical protein ABIE23_01585 [archaeon]
MPLMESQILTEKAELKYLNLAFDEGDEVIPLMKQALMEAGIDNAKIVGCSGIIRQGIMNYFQKSFYKSRELNNTRVMNGSGRFVKEGNDFRGDFHIAVLIGSQYWNGTLVKGIASDGFSIRIEFISFLTQ